MTSIIDDVVERLKNLTFPILHDRIRDDIHSMIGSQVEGLTLTPMEHNLLVERIVTRYKDAMMAEHEPVGIIAAQTIAENQVQSSLSSHHHAGLRRGAVGFERIEQITSMDNTGICKLVTNPIVGPDGHMAPLEHKDIYELANTMIYLVPRDLMKGHRIMEGDHPQWYRLRLRLMAISSSNLQSKWMRVTFDPDLMYRYRVTLPRIADTIAEIVGDSGVVLYPPSTIGTYVDIHIPSDDTDGAKYRRLGTLMSAPLSGIYGVTTAYTLYENLLEGLNVLQVGPNEYMVEGSTSGLIPDFAWQHMLRSMVPDAQFLGPRRFRSNLSLDQVRAHILDVPLKYADVPHVIKNEGSMFKVEFDTSIVDQYPYLEYADLSPVQFETREEMDEFLLDIMVDRHLFWYIEAICPNIAYIFQIPTIDATRSYTTSPHDCRTTLGYLAMRQMMYDEIKDNIKVDNIWLKTMVNNMTVYKYPVAITRHSIRHDRSEWMTFATFEEVLKWMVRAAFTGETDSINSISSRTIVGEPISIGRGGKNLETSNKFDTLLKNAEEEAIRRQQRQSNISNTTRPERRSRGSTAARPSRSSATGEARLSRSSATVEARSSATRTSRTTATSEDRATT